MCILIYNQYGVYLLPHTMKDNVDGWMADYQTIWRIAHKNMQIQGKYIWFHLTARQRFSHNFVNV